MINENGKMIKENGLGVIAYGVKMEK